MCRNDPDRPLKLEVFEWRRVKGVIYNFYVTECPLTLNKIQNGVGTVQTMYANKLAHGKLKIVDFEKKYQFQFIDYIHGGCDISILLAMDFTLHNGHYKNSESLHYMPTKASESKKDDSGNILNGSSLNVNSQGNVNRNTIKTTTRVEQMIKKSRGVGQATTNKKRAMQLEQIAAKMEKVYMNEY